MDFTKKKNLIESVMDMHQEAENVEERLPEAYDMTEQFPEQQVRIGLFYFVSFRLWCFSEKFTFCSRRAMKTTKCQLN